MIIRAKTSLLSEKELSSYHFPEFCYELSAFYLKSAQMSGKRKKKEKKKGLERRIIFAVLPRKIF